MNRFSAVRTTRCSADCLRLFEEFGMVAAGPRVGSKENRGGDVERRL